MRTFQVPDASRREGRLAPLLIALAILLASIILGTQIYWSVRDTQSFWQQEQLERERAVERIKTLQGDFQVTRATRAP